MTASVRRHHRSARLSFHKMLHYDVPILDVVQYSCATYDKHSRYTARLMVSFVYITVSPNIVYIHNIYGIALS